MLLEAVRLVWGQGNQAWNMSEEKKEKIIIIILYHAIIYLFFPNPLLYMYLVLNSHAQKPAWVLPMMPVVQANNLREPAP